MSRPDRVEYEGAYYHVVNRGSGRRDVYHGAKYYQGFIACLEQAHKRFGLEIHAYCLMSNHYHLLVRTPRGSLGRSMRHVNGVYTQHYNRLRKTDGPLFKGRYKAINIEASSYLLEVSRYIHRNPVQTKKPLVSKLEDYGWSSYRSYRKLSRTPEWLYKESIFEELGSGQPTAAYGRFVEQGLDEETEKFYLKNRWPAVRGSAGFVDKAHLHALAESREVKKHKAVIPFNSVVRAISDYYDCSAAAIVHSKRGRQERNTARWVAMKLSVSAV